jgi:TolB-like protein/Flp pilus assembly protein TadD
MKRCPACNRLETDDALLFCRADGTALVSDSSPPDSEAGTTRLGSAPVATEIETSILPHKADAAMSRGNAPTTVLPAQPPSSATRELTKPKRRRVLIAGVLLIAAVFTVAAYFYLTRKDKEAIQLIAVMPFVNESGNADVEYLSDGMTETLISSLSQLPNLNVRPRSSVFRYKGKETSPQTVGKELNVQAILNGRVSQRGQELSLFVELIDVSLDKVIWSQQYNRKQADIVTLQTDIARDVSSKLTTKLSGADEARVTKTYTANPEAYQLYLKGNYYRSKYTDEAYKKGIEYYRQAIEIEPNYALAYIGIANTCISVSEVYLPATEALPKAKAAALKALELDNTLAEAHALLGAVSIWYEWDWAAAERELKRAIELDPNNAEAHHSYGWYLAMTGRLDSAISEAEYAQRLAPLDINLSSDLAGFYNFAGRYDKAVEQDSKTIEIDPNSALGYNGLGVVYERKRQFPEAIAAMEKAHSLDNSPWLSGFRGYVYAAAGKKGEAEKVLDELKELSKRQYVPAYNVAFIYAGLNDKDKAFAWLNKAYETHSGLSVIKVETTFDNLRSDPRFKEMLKRLNLPE